MAMVPNANPFEDAPFTALSSSAMPREAAIMSSQFDWKETPEAHVLQAEVPGLKKEEMKIEVEDGRVLQVSGERQVEKQDDNEASHHVERSTCKFKKCFTLPTNAKLDQMKASMENGVLTITVPKNTDVKAIENAY